MSYYAPALTIEIMADAAVSVFDQSNDGLSSTYKRFETEIQRSLHHHLIKQTKADWKREVDINGLSFQGSWSKYSRYGQWT